MLNKDSLLVLLILCRPLTGITEINTTRWSHPFAWGPTNNNFAVKKPWPTGVDHAEESYQSRPETVLLMPVCKVGPWLASGTWILGGFSPFPK